MPGFVSFASYFLCLKTRTARICDAVMAFRSLVTHSDCELVQKYQMSKHTQLVIRDHSELCGSYAVVILTGQLLDCAERSPVSCITLLGSIVWKPIINKFPEV